MPAHPIVHVELSANTAAAASKFYQDVFGWKIQHAPEVNYYMFSAEGGPGGGWAQVDENTRAGDVLVYIGTDDIEATLKDIEKAGGKILMHKTEIPGVGWFGQFTDPTGNRLALYTDMKPTA